MIGHTLCWADIPVVDLARAAKFYSAVLADEVSVFNEGGGSMALLPHDENVSGCLYVSEENRPSLQGPLVYLSVEGRLDAATAAIRENGGRVLEEKIAIGPHGFRVVFADTEGNRLALHSSVA